MIQGHRRGEGAGEADTNLDFPAATETNEALCGRSASAIQDTVWRSGFGFEVEPSLLTSKMEMRDRGPLPDDIMK